MLGLEDGLVTATRDGQLHVLGVDLTERRALPIAGGKGPTSLYACRDGQTWWTVRQDGFFSLWRIWDFACVSRGRFSCGAGLGAVDDLGRLWVINEDLALMRVQGDPLKVEKVAQLDRAVQALVHLAPNHGPGGLERLVGQPQPSPR